MIYSKNSTNLMSKKDIEQYLANPLLDEEKKLYINKLINNGAKLYFDKNLNTIYSADTYLTELESEISKSSDYMLYSVIFSFFLFFSVINSDIPLLFKYLGSFVYFLIYLGLMLFAITDIKRKTKKISSIKDENKDYLDLVSMSNTIINNTR